MQKIEWLEIPTDDIGRARKFYSELFGWKIEESPLQRSDEYMIMIISAGGEVSGGVMKQREWGHKAVNYINVSSTERYAGRAMDLGGKILIPKTAVPGMGYFVICQDTEENALGMWEDDKNAL